MIREFESEEALQGALDAINDAGGVPDAPGRDAFDATFIATLVDLGDEAPLHYVGLNAEGRVRDDRWTPSFPVTLMMPESDGCDCIELCSMGPTCPGGLLAGLPGSGCWRSESADSGRSRLGACTCDGAAYYSDTENASRRPFIVNAGCPVHGSQPADSGAGL